QARVALAWPHRPGRWSYPDCRRGPGRPPLAAALSRGVSRSVDGPDPPRPVIGCLARLEVDEQQLAGPPHAELAGPLLDHLRRLGLRDLLLQRLALPRERARRVLQ